ncbi:lateendosome to vacuole transport-family protein [Coprinellus micaceus]|uniref:Lateendosome to vacuole transport-family protein n=1 Tax=Coprinellus micaceus TaxID=71717 RepID=A0A4Y7TTZ9_COPMI|nr:lateendosome to vacuole transport-family protein [Coprinellus micaceus]
MSRTSSISNLRAPSSASEGASASLTEVFRWSELQLITKELYPKSMASQKALHILGSPAFGSPTVLAANGLICIGLNDGRICVYDFKQTLKAVCGDEGKASILGSVTALALSHDHTCVASGHATGHIQLFDLKKPLAPIRSVPPTSIAVVATGRKEGHLQGSRIVSIGFIAGRHTAIVSADEHGLAFYHSLGKMLFVEASDILRILGQYPEVPTVPGAPPSYQPPHRRKYTILAMASLPLGTTPHPTDAYDVVALLTPTKLVVVGLRPTPKTWFKCPRQAEERHQPRSQMKGTIAWFPSVPSTREELGNVVADEGRESDARDPILAYTWGNSLRLIKVSESRYRQRVRSAKTGRMNDINLGAVSFEELGKWSAEETILALQWLNANQLVIVSTSDMSVYDIQLSKLVEKTTYDGLSLVSPTLNMTATGSVAYADSVADIAHSLRVYKGKMFSLGRDRLLVGSLLTWADRILALVEAGDFLAAIELCRTYYTDQAPGNRNGLPQDSSRRKEIIGSKLRSLMDASARYAFAEERLTDDTHVTPDHRGVDRTSLFEGLVGTCCQACIALNDFEFLFEDLFQCYDDNYIAPIYLRQLEPFILDSTVQYVPPRITQRLVALHEADGQSEYVERLIWHMDPSCLDLNQSITLCQRFHLYDALIYIYTRALRDYVAPIVELLALVRQIQQYRHRIGASPGNTMGVFSSNVPVESLLLNSYKIYPYLSNVLSGLSYPSEQPLPDEEAFEAKKALYTFLFFGRSSVWPPGDGGKLVLTADEEGGLEPTYPYARQLLRFDAEAFLHSLDIAFEDAYMNDESQSVNRLIIVRILLEIIAGGHMESEDVTLVNIFIARNVPKYPQFLQIAPTVLHNILTGLAEDPDFRTREDRQLAAEYLLSVYNPHDIGTVTALFEEAGFYRILRAWYRHDRQWALLLCTYINDQQLLPNVLFENIHHVLRVATRHNKGSLPSDVADTLANSIPHLLSNGIRNTAALLDVHSFAQHETALLVLRNDFEDPDRASYEYLRQLFIPPHDDEDTVIPHKASTAADRPSTMRDEFVDLQSRLHPKDLVQVLQAMDRDSLQWPKVIDICERNEAWHTVVWALNYRHQPQAALKKAESYYKQLTRRVIELFDQGSHIGRELDLLHSIGLTGRDVCLEQSQSHSSLEVPLEDLWYSLLSSQVQSVQTVSAVRGGGDRLDQVLGALRTSVQATFTALVSITSTQTVSFPRLFKRLVNSTPTATGIQYTEFRLILGGMLESYRSDGDMLVITKHLIDRDLFDTVAHLTVEKGRGWSPTAAKCSVCRKPIIGTIPPVTQDPLESTRDNPARVSLQQIVISRTGSVSHHHCLSIPCD